jgi:hypothetical protein
MTTSLGRELLTTATSMNALADLIVRDTGTLNLTADEARELLQAASVLRIAVTKTSNALYDRLNKDVQLDAPLGFHRGIHRRSGPLPPGFHRGIARRTDLTYAELAAYLPNNYYITELLDEARDAIEFEGTDVAGWTFNDYVVPRLASGLIFVEEL